MNRKVIRIVSILLMVLMVVTMLSTSVFAESLTDATYTDMAQFKTASKDNATTSVTQGLVATIINVVQVVGMGVAIIMLVVMAIKYVSAAPSEKAEIKKSAAIYVVGAVVLFAAAGILQVIKNFADNNLNIVSNNTGCVEIQEIDDTYLG